MAMHRVWATIRKFSAARPLLSLAVMVGMLGSQSAGGTLAFFTSSAAVTGNSFTSGTLTMGAALSGTSLSWGTSQGGTDCLTSTSGTLITTQRFTPGTYCVAKLTLTNSGNIDGELRVRLVRTTGSSAAAQALNDLLKISVAELATGSTTCTTAFWTPTSESFASLPAGYTQVSSSTTSISNLALSGITAEDTTFSAAGTANTASSFINIIGNDAITDVGSGTVEALSVATGSRYFCVAMLFPIGTLPTTNTTGDNAAQTAIVAYAFHSVMGQQSNRGG